MFTLFIYFLIIHNIMTIPNIYKEKRNLCIVSETMTCLLFIQSINSFPDNLMYVFSVLLKQDQNRLSKKKKKKNIKCVL